MTQKVSPKSSTKKNKKTTLNNLNPRWWQLKYFFTFIPIWGRWTHFDPIFFKWVGATTNQLKWKKLWVTSPSFFPPTPRTPLRSRFCSSHPDCLDLNLDQGAACCPTLEALLGNKKNQRNATGRVKKNMGDIRFFWGLEKIVGNVYMAKIDFANMFLWVCLLFQVYKSTYLCLCTFFL